MIEFEVEEKQKGSIVSIAVVGVGGAGGNTINSIIESGYGGITFIAANTDAQALEFSKATHKVQLGVKSTKGLGTGANPELGKRAAEEDLDKIMEVIGDADIVFLTAGLGGGTGSGALPVIAKALKESGILSIAVVTKPFLFEGVRRKTVAEQAVNALRSEIDTLIVIPNQRLLEVTEKNISMIDAFAMVNEILSQSVKGISDIIARPGHINVDFADVRTIMKDMGLAVMGTGCASGDGRAVQAARKAVSSPLLENMNIQGAHGVLLNITGGNSLGIHEISDAASIIYEQAAQDAHIIVGSVVDDAMNDEISVTVIATGFEQQEDNSGHRAAQRIQHEATPGDSMCIDEGSACLSEEVHEETSELISSTEDQLNETEVLDSTYEGEQCDCDAPKENDAIDYNDLDVPTFLRKKTHEKNDVL